MVDADELARLLASTPLGGRAVEILDHDRLLVRIEPGQIWPAWLAARSVVELSGRWPVLHTASDGFVELTEVLPNPPDAGAAVAAAVALDARTAWHRTWRDIPLTPSWLPTLISNYGLTEEQARQFVDAEVLLDDVEWFRLAQRLAEVDGDASRIEVSEHLTDRDLLWYTPRDAVGVVFLTSPSPLEALADVDYFGGTGPALVAVGRAWHERYGAELVAAWGTMLQFVTARRPTSLADAWELAGQQLRIGGNLDIDRDDLALALMRTNFWFLHERP